ncbi:elongation of very long chain fatty acids protein 4 [Bombyx mori]|uniref:Elongation of very long chain fatty acids protein n=1 Tax=Bombyx mori TaxID=7091 RepID=A0A8R2M573_BOMMO|nr:elongation of very long chain fatty acids protein 4 [Bombyx mori]
MDGTMFGTKSNYWDLNKSKFAVIDQLPLMGSVSPVLTVLAIYLIFVIKIGPAYMRKREAYKLTFVLLAYNAVQVAISGYLVARFFLDLRRMGLVPSKCYLNEENSRNQIIFGTYLYLTAKFSELLDTVFFVLRKKYSQITFLHLYHHTVMVIATWAMLKYWPSHTLIYIGFINSLVHVFMYSYYGLAALGPGVAKYLTWKKYMTKFQIIQFISIILQYVAAIRISECPPSKGVALFVFCNTAFILLLFLNFYLKSYSANKTKKAAEEVVNSACFVKKYD